MLWVIKPENENWPSLEFIENTFFINDDRASLSFGGSFITFGQVINCWMRFSVYIKIKNRELDAKIQRQSKDFRITHATTSIATSLIFLNFTTISLMGFTRNFRESNSKLIFSLSSWIFKYKGQPPLYSLQSFSIWEIKSGLIFTVSPCLCSLTSSLTIGKINRVSKISDLVSRARSVSSANLQPLPMVTASVLNIFILPHIARHRMLVYIFASNN